MAVDNPTRKRPQASDLLMDVTTYLCRNYMIIFSIRLRVSPHSPSDSPLAVDSPPVQDAAGNPASVFYYNIAVEEVDVLASIHGSEETLKQDMLERHFLR